MEKRTFLGIDTTPRRELWARIEELELELDAQLEKRGKLERSLDESKNVNTAYARELSREKRARANHEQTLKQQIASLQADRAAWREKYHTLLDDTPARGKGGRFVKRNAADAPKMFKTRCKDRDHIEVVDIAAEAPCSPGEPFAKEA